MNRYVIDASVAIKWFVPEIHSDVAARLLDAPGELIAPDFLFLEIANILWKKTWRNEIKGGECRTMLADMGKIPLHIHSASSLLDVAVDFAVEYRRSVYDSLYVALAVTQETRLLTADKKLFNALVGSGLGAVVVSLETIHQHRK